MKNKKYAKVLKTSFGVSIATIYSGAIAQETSSYPQQKNQEPFSGYIYKLPSSVMFISEIYDLISNTSEASNVKVFKQDSDLGPIEVDMNDKVVLDQRHPTVFLFSDENQYANSIDRFGVLLSGGPDGIFATQMIKTASELAPNSIKTYDFFYLKTGRPSDFKEFSSIENYLSNNFKDGQCNLHIIDISTNQMRLVACGDQEVTYNQFGFTSALSLILADASYKKINLDFIMLGIHGADAKFKAQTSNEYSRHFVSSWNDFIKSFYPSSPKVILPLIDIFDKIDILKLSPIFNINVEDTWSCYRKGPIHCGACKSCLERKLAYKVSHLSDPTSYKDKLTLNSNKSLLSSISLQHLSEVS